MNKMYVEQKENLVEKQLIELYPKLQKYCHFLSRNKWDGDDIAQEVIIKVIKQYSHNSISLALLKK